MCGLGVKVRVEEGGRGGRMRTHRLADLVREPARDHLVARPALLDLRAGRRADCGRAVRQRGSSGTGTRGRRRRDAPNSEKRKSPCMLFFSTCSASAAGVSFGYLWSEGGGSAHPERGEFERVEVEEGGSAPNAGEAARRCRAESAIVLGKIYTRHAQHDALRRRARAPSACWVARRRDEPAHPLQPM